MIAAVLAVLIVPPPAAARAGSTASGGPAAFRLETPGGPFARSRVRAVFTLGPSAARITAGWSFDSYVLAYARGWPPGRIPAGRLLIGRDVLGWGPGGEGGLLFSGAGGPFDRVEVTLDWRRATLAKVVGWLDGGRSISGTRLEAALRPGLRAGFSEAIVMAGAPYLPYALVPIPFLVNQYIASQTGRWPQENHLLAVDLEWRPDPARRVFGELLIDDLTVRTPTANFPSRVGLTVGMERAGPGRPALGLTYTIVPNWTYSAQAPELHHTLRGAPLGHPLGADFDLIHLRWGHVWASFIRKGEGQVGRLWSDETEANTFVFLRGVVERSVVVGLERGLGGEGWSGTAGPWVAWRSNAGHVPGATRVDWGLSLRITGSFR